MTSDLVNSSKNDNGAIVMITRDTAEGLDEQKRGIGCQRHAWEPKKEYHVSHHKDKEEEGMAIKL